ncbi:MAG TPA: sensor histidine kinase [Bryobacteraceae bacterium]|nr:sensor histidine kinase [Bryobacteraceae bacterium]
MHLATKIHHQLAGAVAAAHARVPNANDTTARVLHWLLIGLLIWFVLYLSVILPFFNIKRALSAVLAVLGIVIWAATLWLVRRGLIEWAALLYLSALYVSATLLILLYGGIRSPATVLYVALPISAAWLLGQRAALVSALVCLASGFVLALLETAGLRIPAYFPGTPFGIWALVLLALIVSAAPVVLILGMLRESLSRSRALSHRLLALEDEERRRVARGLHDSVAQDIAALGMNLGALQDEVSVVLSSKAQGVLSDTIALADHCLDEIRTFSYLLHPPGLEELGLRAALSEYVHGFAKRSGIRVEVLAPDLARLPGPTEAGIFRVVQESLANIHRHSGSQVARVRITLAAQEVILEVEDEGHGLPAGVINGYGRPLHPGVGISGMSERLRDLGGRLEFRRREPTGTIVRAVFPITHA